MSGLRERARGKRTRLPPVRAQFRSREHDRPVRLAAFCARRDTRRCGAGRSGLLPLRIT